MSWLILREQVVKVGECLWESCLCLKGELGVRLEARAVWGRISQVQLLEHLREEKARIATSG